MARRAALVGADCVDCVHVEWLPNRPLRVYRLLCVDISMFSWLFMDPKSREQRTIEAAAADIASVRRLVRTVVSGGVLSAVSNEGRRQLKRSCTAVLNPAGGSWSQPVTNPCGEASHSHTAFKVTSEPLPSP